MGDLILHPGSSSAAAGGALIVQDPEHLAKLREERIEEVCYAALCCTSGGWAPPGVLYCSAVMPRHRRFTQYVTALYHR